MMARNVYQSRVYIQWLLIVPLMLVSTVSSQTCRWCRSYQLSAFRYFMPDLWANAALSLTGGSNGIASLNGISLTVTIPKFLNLTSRPGSSATSGDSSCITTVNFVLSSTGQSITCTYNGIGTGLYPWSPEQANAYQFSSCNDVLPDGSTSTGQPALQPDRTVSVSQLTMRIVSAGETSIPNDPTVVNWNITEISTAGSQCQPFNPTTWYNVGGNGMRGGIILSATNGLEPSPTCTANPTTSPTGDSSSSGIIRPTSSQDPIPSNGGGGSGEKSEWVSPLGNLTSTIIISTVVLIVLVLLILLALWLMRRASLICRQDQFYTPTNTSNGRKKPVYGKEVPPPYDSNYSVNISHETMVDMYNRQYQNEQYFSHASMSQDFDAVYSDSDAVHLPYPAHSFVDIGPTIPNMKRVTNEEMAADCTLMNTRAEIALPGFLKMDYHNDIRQDVVMAEGGGGIVYQAELLDDRLRLKHRTNRVVVKLVKNPGNWSHEELLNHFRQEVSIMWSLNFHDHVIRLIGYSEEPMAIVTRLYAFSLMDLINDGDRARQILTAQNVLRFSFQVVAAMKEMHEMDIVHRDLKTANLLIEVPIPSPNYVPPNPSAPSLQDDPTFWKVVLCDFGLAKIIGDTGVKASKVFDVQGISVRYAAPEVFKKMHVHMMKSKKAQTISSGNVVGGNTASRNETETLASQSSKKENQEQGDVARTITDSSKNGSHRIEDPVEVDEEAKGELEKKSDIYAYSIVLWEMMAKQNSWRGLKNDEIEWNVRNGERPPLPVIPEDVSEESKDISVLLIDCMQDSWNQDPFSRPSFTHVLQMLHPFYQKLPQPTWTSYSASTQHARHSTQNLSMRLGSIQPGDVSAMYNSRAGSIHSNSFHHQRALTFGSQQSLPTMNRHQRQTTWDPSRPRYPTASMMFATPSQPTRSGEN